MQLCGGWEASTAAPAVVSEGSSDGVMECGEASDQVGQVHSSLVDLLPEAASRLRTRVTLLFRFEAA